MPAPPRWHSDRSARVLSKRKSGFRVRVFVPLGLDWLFPLPASRNHSKRNTEGSRLGFQHEADRGIVFRLLFGCFGLELSRGFTDETPVIKDPGSTRQKNFKNIWQE